MGSTKLSPDDFSYRILNDGRVRVDIKDREHIVTKEKGFDASSDLQAVVTDMLKTYDYDVEYPKGYEDKTLTTLTYHSYGGIDWNDSYSVSRQIKSDGKPFVSDVRQATIDSIFETYNNPDANNVLDKSKIAAVYDGDLDEYVVPLNMEHTIQGHTKIVAPGVYKRSDGFVDYENKLTISKSENGDMQATFDGGFGQFSTTDTYSSHTMKQSDAVFIPMKIFYRSVRDGNTYESMTADAFSSYEDAVQFMEQYIQNDKESDWYKHSVQNMRDREALGITKGSAYYSEINYEQTKLVEKIKSLIGADLDEPVYKSATWQQPRDGKSVTVRRAKSAVKDTSKIDDIVSGFDANDEDEDDCSFGE